MIVVCTDRTDEKVVYQNKTSGTVRTDFRGGEPVRYEERPQVKEEVHLFDRPFDPAVGKVTKQFDSHREIKLTSGTKRTDLK